MNKYTKYNGLYFSPLKDIQISQQMIQSAKSVTQNSENISREWLITNNWRVLLFADPIDYPEAEMISHALRRQEHSLCYAVTIRVKSTGDKLVFPIPITQNSLVALGGESSIVPLLMLPTDVSFAILLHGDLAYYAVAGTTQFLRQLVKHSAEKTKSDFITEIESEDQKRQDVLWNTVFEYYAPFLLED